VAKIQRSRLICLLLALVTLVLYWPVTGFDFLNIDDPDYILNNTAIHQGLTWQGIVWAFRTSYASNWHPVTWLSHMLDCSLYGWHPGGHHLTNLLLHMANAMLVFLLLERLTGATWRSAFVAALFAWHPLHVESVAWVSERKDVLSTFFALLALGAYAGYAREPKSSRRRVLYLLTLFLFALGLMSKPMLVTLPFVMLLLDFWPLERNRRSAPAGSQSGAIPAGSPAGPGWGKLLIEKVPFFALSGLDCLATIWAQKGSNSIVSWSALPLPERISNALVSVFAYLGQMAWPRNLAVLYPYSHEWGAGIASVAAVLLVLITAGAIWQSHRPYLLVGWLWYLGTLVPVIGLLQVGIQWMADRYTYIPSLGIFIMVAWGGAALLEARPAWTRPACVLAAVSLIALAVCTRVQLQYWRNSVSLFSRAVAVTHDSIMAEYNLGEALGASGDQNGAITHYLHALEIHPNRVEACYNSQTVARFNLGAIYAGQGRFRDAETQFRAILSGEPDHTRAHDALGSVLLAQGRAADAAEEFRRVTENEPSNEQAWHRLGVALLQAGRVRDGIEALRKAVRLPPKDAAAFTDLAWVLATNPDDTLRDGAEAVQLAQRACELTASRDARCLASLDAAFAEAGRFPEAISAAQQTASVATSNGEPDLAAAASHRIELYRAGKPYRGD
jgi:tetratricopeptide (TPR) repeat protein